MNPQQGTRDSGLGTRDRGRATRGAALLLTLLLIVLLAVVVGAFHFGSRIRLRMAQGDLAAVRREAAFRSALLFARRQLEADMAKAGGFDHAGEPWGREGQSLQLGEERVEYRIEDEGRRFNVTRLVGAEGKIDAAALGVFRRLARAVVPEGPPELAERVADWLDADSEGTHESGARNEPPRSPSDLLRIEGIEPEVWQGDGTAERPGLLQFLTLWPAGPGGLQINVNTAPHELLVALDEDEGESIAEAVAAYRERIGEDGNPMHFGSVDEVKTGAGVAEAAFNRIQPHLAVGSGAFSVFARSAVGRDEAATGAPRTSTTGEVRYVVVRAAAGPSPEQRPAGPPTKLVWRGDAENPGTFPEPDEQ